MITIDKNTKIYGSFSSNPGSNGCVFFNKQFQQDGINAIYKSFYSDNIQKSTVAAKTLNFSGFAVSSPFKVDVLQCVDEVDFSAEAIGAANTVINNNGLLKAYNTDWLGVYKFLCLRSKPKRLHILGSGGFGKAVEYACDKLGVPCGFIKREEWHTLPYLEDTVFNATPVEVGVQVKGTLIDGRPFIEGEGKVIANLQAKEQYEIYKKWMT